MNSYQDYLGKKINKLLILDVLTINGRSFYKCRCDCGTVKNIRCDNVINGKAKSCGCLLGSSIHPDVEAEIISLRKSGLSYRKIAERLCLGRNVVYNFCNKNSERINDTEVNLWND